VSSIGPSSPTYDASIADLRVRAVLDDEWGIVAWLWQAYRNDLAVVVNGLPYADGRYQSARLKKYPSLDAAGYLAWRAHPKTGEESPLAFAVVEGLEGDRRSIEGFWVAPAARREGTGRHFALDVLSRHEGPWTIVFQHDNVGALLFWRNVADGAFGAGRWSEEERAVPGLPDVPPDHFILSL
jgi:ribosomal protein S18 acetylase RimI-like enzyme